ncbi:MAG: hypothetical protein HY866_08265 [Chloroflexi bacterium]|nr:hypothetical protein [Chloroflexota bacterium]
MNRIVDNSFTLVTSMTIADCLSRLRWIPLQGGSHAAKRFNKVYSKEVDEGAKSFRLTIEDIIFLKPQVEAIGRLEDSNGSTLIHVEIKNTTPTISKKGFLFLALWFSCMAILSIINAAYLLLFLLFGFFSIIGYLYSFFGFRNMLLDTIKQNLDAT